MNLLRKIYSYKQKKKMKWEYFLTSCKNQIQNKLNLNVKFEIIKLLTENIGSLNFFFNLSPQARETKEK